MTAWQSASVVKKRTFVLLLLLLLLPTTGSILATPLPLESAFWLPDPLASAPEISRWANEVVPRQGAPANRLRWLARALLDPRRLGLIEDDRFTPTAVEAFTFRRADCVGFAFLAKALGEAVGLELDLVLVDGVIARQQQGGLNIERRHLAVALRSVDEPLVLDFGGLSVVDPNRVRAIDSTTGQAIYFANRSAQSLLAGEIEGALFWGRAALVLAPDLAAARDNFSAAWRRSGQ